MVRAIIAFATWVLATSPSFAAPSQPIQQASIRISKSGGMGRANARLEATRSPTGLWTVSYENRSDFSGLYRASAVLPQSKAVVLDSMLRNSRLYLQQARVSSENHNLECLDGPNTTTEVSFEGRRLTVTAECLDNEGITRSISDLLFSSLPQRPCPTGVTCISTRQGR